jgi:hypothetical protein
MSRGRNGKPLDLSSQTPAQITVIQSRIHVQQLRNEATSREMASNAAEDGDDVIVIFDRAAPDGQAFADARCWAKLVDSAPVDPLQYELVLELHSTALLAWTMPNKILCKFTFFHADTKTDHKSPIDTMIEQLNFGN